MSNVRRLRRAVSQSSIAKENAVARSCLSRSAGCAEGSASGRTGAPRVFRLEPLFSQSVGAAASTAILLRSAVQRQRRVVVSHFSSRCLRVVPPNEWVSGRAKRVREQMLSRRWGRRQWRHHCTSSRPAVVHERGGGYSLFMNEPPSCSSPNQTPNPSIEGTCNIWLRQLSPAPHVKR